MPCLSLSVQRDTATLSNRSSGNSPRSGEQHLPSRASGRGSGVFGSRPPWPFSPGSMRSEGGAASHSPLFSQVQRLPFRLLVSHGKLSRWARLPSRTSSRSGSFHFLCPSCFLFSQQPAPHLSSS